jgi:hypothetical protein
MKKQIIGWAMTALIEALPENSVKVVIDFFLDKVEKLVEDTDNRIDDATVLPICGMIRRALDIPDED